MTAPKKPWLLTPKEILASLESSPEGLSEAESKKRLAEYGPNKIAAKNQRTALKIFISQFQNWLILVLVGATAISFLLGEHLDAVVILSLIIVSVLMGFYQEYRAESALKKLQKFITHHCQLMRSGHWQAINSEDLVLGDIVELHIGDKVPADLRIINCDGLSVDEGVLTGESAPVLKQVIAIKTTKETPADLTNMLFMGSFISGGNCRGIVTAIGTGTFFGQTVMALEKKAPLTDFQKETQKFSNFLFKVILLLTIFIFASNSILGKGLLSSLLFALALTVGITPELLPVITTITLSQGALKMAKLKVVVKRLMAVEDFGNIDTLCTDKTGTLTTGIFSLASFIDIKGDISLDLLMEGLLCSTRNNPTDIALWMSVDAKKLEPKVKQYQIIDVNEFDYERQRMSVVVALDDNKELITKGAPESVLKVCKLDKKQHEALKLQVKKYEESGFRVLAVAKKYFGDQTSTLKDEFDLDFSGFLLFRDPIKPSAIEALKLLQRLQVNIKIISGDSVEVVKKVAAEVGLSVDRIVSGEMLEERNPTEFEALIKDNILFARVTPKQKYDIVATLNKEGHIVGFLGDGVNDAPALKAADVGIAVNTGSEVAKEAASIILLHKDLKVLAEGIELGRKTFGNITKYIFITISANFGNMVTLAASSLFLPFIPLLPAQILLNNFLSDIPMLAIASDNVDHKYTLRPRRWNINLIRNFMIYFGIISSVFDLALIIPLIYFFKASPEVFRTAWFVESALSEMLILFVVRTRLSIFKSVPSRLITILAILSMIIATGITFLGIGRGIFSFTSLKFPIWLWIGIVLLSYFAVTEIVKHYFFNKFDSEPK
ncbi:MAG: magnesium-translocating P-type ATPase [candidate division WWE3 bacterium]|nr:magnesium-translocating P-type ATPase [candidate division WWE3 bacterium]